MKKSKAANPVFSIIIPVRIENDYLRETLTKLKDQTLKSFEVIVVTDKISGPVSPAIKRNIGAKMAKGKYLAFLDDDSYPSSHWLHNAYRQLSKNLKLTAVCGPCLTPPKDNSLKQASGLVWGSFLGSGGAGTYRNNISSKRYVDDFPSVNLIVVKKDFISVNGFNTHHWPGEDTILCLELITKLNKKILYHPKIVVYHHRRNVIIPHLQQITRYALHRGLFARIYPKTSRKLGYFIPSFFFLYVITLCFSPILFFFHVPFFIFQLLLFPLYLYLFFLLLTFISFLFKSKSFITSLLAAITIPLTHLYYGYLFLNGLFLKELDFQPHQVDTVTGKYLGG